MRRILFAAAAVALLGLISCSGNESTGSITGPTAVTSATTSGPANFDNPSMKFTATPKETGQKSYWHGDSRPTSIPNTGHPGHVSLSFNQKLTYGATLSWDAPSSLDVRSCSITNNHDATVISVTNCDKGAVDVYPSQTTEYTFKYQYKDHNDWKSGSVHETVTITTSISSDIGLTWEPAAGYQKDDPVQSYTGKATGSFSQLQVSVDGLERCGLGGGNTYNHLHATLVFVPPTAHPSEFIAPVPPELKWAATYTGVTDVASKCTAAEGSVTLIADPDKK